MARTPTRSVARRPAALHCTTSPEDGTNSLIWLVTAHKSLGSRWCGMDGLSLRREKDSTTHGGRTIKQKEGGRKAAPLKEEGLKHHSQVGGGRERRRRGEERSIIARQTDRRCADAVNLGRAQSPHRSKKRSASACRVPLPPPPPPRRCS